MKLEFKGIRLVNCGPIRDVYIDFLDEQGQPLDSCIIAGPNGSGKTTILEVMATLPQLFCRNRFSKIKKKFEYAQIDWLVDGEEVSLCYGKQPADVRLAKSYLSYDENRERKKQGGIPEVIHKLIHQEEEGEVVCRELEEIKRSPEKKLPGIIYFPHARYLEEVEGKSVNREVITSQFIYRYQNTKEFEGSLNSYLIYLDYAKPTEFDLIIKFLNRINFDTRKTFNVDRETLKVMVTTDTGEKHSIEELSSGEQNIVIMLLELRRRLVAPHFIVLIDEIENSLHPALQAYFAHALQKLQEEIPFQLIVTTHSAEFLKSFGPRNVRLLNGI